MEESQTRFIFTNKTGICAGAYRLADEWFDRALVRYFELWGGVTESRIMRAVKGKKRVSAAWTRAIKNLSEYDVVEADDREIWRVVRPSLFYTWIHRFPDLGIARALARARNSERPAEHSAVCVVCHAPLPKGFGPCCSKECAFAYRQETNTPVTKETR